MWGFLFGCGEQKPRHGRQVMTGLIMGRQALSFNSQDAGAHKFLLKQNNRSVEGSNKLRIDKELRFCALCPDPKQVNRRDLRNVDGLFSLCADIPLHWFI